MVEAWVIEEERKRQEVDERPRIQLPMPYEDFREPEKKDVQSDRGVVIIRIGYDEEEET